MTIAITDVHHMYLRRKPKQTWRRPVIVAIALAFIVAIVLWLAQYELDF